MADAIKTVYFDVEGREPDYAEVKELSSLPMKKAAPGGPEVKDAMKGFGSGLGIGILLGLFALFMFSRFRGLGVLIFGGAAAIGCPFMIIYGFYSFFQMFRSAQKKTPEKAARWFWITSVIGESTTASTRFASTQYALSTMRRMLPEGLKVHEAKELEFLNGLRGAMTEAMDESTEPRRAGGASPASPTVRFTLAEQQDISEDLAKVRGLLDYYDALSVPSGANKTARIHTAHLQLRITQYYIRNGKSWFPYDLTPAWKRAEESPAEEPATLPETPEA